MLTHQYAYVFAAVDVCTGELDSLVLPQVNTQCMQLFLDAVSLRHPDEKIVMVIDVAGWHRSDKLKTPDNIYLLKLPPTPQRSIRLSTSGMGCTRSSFTTAFSKGWTLWRPTLWRHSGCRSKTPQPSPPSYLGPGLLRAF